MQTYKVNFHIHTNYSDGHYTSEEILSLAKKGRYNVIAITDHNDIRASREACLAQEKYNLLVIPGVELFFLVGFKLYELLAYFPRLEELELFFSDFLENKFLPRFKTPEKVIALVHKYSGVTVAPHPFGNKGLLRDYPELNVCGYEYHNSFASPVANGVSEKFENPKGAVKLSGLDFHNGYRNFENSFMKIKTNKDISENILNLFDKKNTIEMVINRRSTFISKMYKTVVCLPLWIKCLCSQYYHRVFLKTLPEEPGEREDATPKSFA